MVPLQWRYAMEHYIPKTRPPCPSNVKDVCPIALLNVEGKLFFSLISKRLVNQIITNNNLNISVQKGCVDKVPGCWEHMSMVWSALNEAQSTKSCLANISLDIANAYESISHRLLFFALEHYGADPHWISLIKIYLCRNLQPFFFSVCPKQLASAFQGNFCLMHFVNNSFSGRDKCGNSVHFGFISS